jgi:hypothetical protein
MKKALLVLSFLLGGCATGGALDTSATEQSGSTVTATATARDLAANATQVAISSFEGVAVCRKERPTGSRIAIERCRAPSTPADELERKIERQDFESMRQQQIYREQARQAAEAAMRQRGGGVR